MFSDQLQLSVTRLCYQPVRYGIDAWDEMMMDRDRRLTGHSRGQSVRVSVARNRYLANRFEQPQTDPIAPESFATNSTWYTERT